MTFLKINFDFYGIFSAVDEENKEENVDSNGPQDANVIDELQKMNIKQLREEAAKRGISASGTKKELLDRLCTHNDNVERDNDLGTNHFVFIWKNYFCTMPLSILGRLIKLETYSSATSEFRYTCSCSM